LLDLAYQASPEEDFTALTVGAFSPVPHSVKGIIGLNMGPRNYQARILHAFCLPKGRIKMKDFRESFLLFVDPAYRSLCIVVLVKTAITEGGNNPSTTNFALKRKFK